MDKIYKFIENSIYLFILTLLTKRIKKMFFFKETVDVLLKFSARTNKVIFVKDLKATRTFLL